MSALRRPASDPSETRIPSFRPSKRFGSVLDDAQGRGGIEILTRRHGGVRRFRHLLQAQFAGDFVGQRLVDIQEMGDHALPDRGYFDLAEFERQSGGYVRLLPHGLTDEELTCLAVVVREAFGAQAAFGALFDRQRMA